MMCIKCGMENAHPKDVKCWHCGEPLLRASTGSAIDGDLIAVARHGLDCAKAWEGKARLIGNCRAEDLAKIFAQFISQNVALSSVGEGQ